MQLGVSQKVGPTLSQLESWIQSICGESSKCWTTNGTVKQLRISGGAFTIARVLGQLRPQRLLSKFRPELLGCVSSPDLNNDPVASITELTPMGARMEIVRSEIDTGTYIVEGYPHHNSFYQHDESYLTPMANKCWRGILMLHEVQDGQFDEMMVSIDFLRKRYK